MCTYTNDYSSEMKKWKRNGRSLISLLRCEDFQMPKVIYFSYKFRKLNIDINIVDNSKFRLLFRQLMETQIKLSNAEVKISK